MELTPHSNVDLNFESSGKTKGKYLVLDTETTGMLSKQAILSADPGNIPRIIQIAWFLFDEEGKLINSNNRYIIQEFPIPSHSIRVHGIDDPSIQQKGEKPITVWSDFINDLEDCDFVVAHNTDFDIPLIESELHRLHFGNPFAGKRMICTMKQGKKTCKIPADNGHGYKYPALDELYKICFFGRLTELEISGLHDAWVDAAVTSKVFFKLLSLQQITHEDSVEEPFKLPVIRNDEEVAKSKFFINIILPTFLTILLFFLAIFFIIIPRFRENIMLGKRQMIKELTNSAASILEKYESDEQNGLMSRDEAQRTAVSRIQYLRYGDENKDYFWITDMKPAMVMHPYRSDLDGKSLKSFTDPHGKKLFVEMVKVARQSGQGYVEYMWQWKDDSTHIVPKLSFVKAFQPWGWIIGTGIYIEDVKKEISSLTQRLLIISLGISLIIALLLTYITLQSMKIEKQRKNAESLLHISREKYKTLVDATTEGLIMIIDNKMIFSNNKIHELTGYSEKELISQTFFNLLNEKNHPDTLKAFHNRALPDGQYELILSSKNGNLLETIVTITSIVFYEKKGKLITVKDATVLKHPEEKAEDIMQVLELVDIGFIKVLLDTKGKILYAGKSVLKMLGFQSLKELSQSSILDFFSDPAEKKEYRKQLLTEGRIRNATIHIKRKDGIVLIVNVSMIVIKNESEHLLCEGIITDVTRQAEEKKETEEFISRLQAYSLLLQNPVDDVVIPVIVVTTDTPAIRVIDTMKRNHSDAVIISDKNDAKIGIVTANDIIDRILLSDQNFRKPAYEIMSAPLVSINTGASIHEAVNLMLDAGISHLPVRNATGSITGLIHKRDLFPLMVHSFSFIENSIDTAQTAGELSTIYKEFIRYLCMMINQNIQPLILGKSMASISDRITRRLINLAFAEIGDPPVEFVFIALGSEGRLEQTLATDQDNAIIYADVPESDLKMVQSYFNNLGEIVCDQLNAIGFQYCKGRIMAKNPLWTKPLKTWKNYFSEWVSNTEPKNLLDVSIFFDLRPVYGNKLLTDDLRQHINTVSDGNGSFFYNLAENVLSFRSSVGITGNIHTEKKEDKDLFDLKTGVTPYVMFARIYAIHHKINFSNTIERFQALNDLQVLPLSSYKEILLGYNLLMQYRYRNQVEQLGKHKAVNNTMDIHELTEVEEATLKKVLSQSADLQNRLNIDFKRSVL